MAEYLPGLCTYFSDRTLGFDPKFHPKKERKEGKGIKGCAHTAD